MYDHSLEFSNIELKLFHEKLGKKIQQLRQEKGLSQLELSYRIGFKSSSLIAGAEAGYNNVKFSLDHLYKISKALNIEIKDFFE